MSAGGIARRHYRPKNEKGASDGSAFYFLTTIPLPPAGFHCARRFPSPSETKTFPKKCRCLPLLDLAVSVLVDESKKGRHEPMATKGDYGLDRSPLFLSEHAVETEQLDIGKALNRATISSRILKASIMAVAATAIGIAILTVADPVEILGNVTALWVEKSTPQPDAEPPAPATQSIASAPDLPPAQDMPAHEEIAAAAVEPAADPGKAEMTPPVSEELFKQFQAWAAEEESRAKVEPAQPAQAAPVQAQQDAAPQVQPTKKHRRARSVQNARAEIRPHRSHRARVREEQSAPIPIAPVPDPRAQEQSLQYSQPPGFLQSLGFRN